MAETVRYDHRNRNAVALALEAMIENLTRLLKITDDVTTEMDTIENIRELDKDLGQNRSEEDQMQDLNKIRDTSTAELGHIQRRIEDVKQLKAAFENEEPPPPEVIQKTYRALMDSVVFEAIGMSGLVLNPDTTKWLKVRVEEYEGEKKRLFLYSRALAVAFYVWPKMNWHLFPFDSA